MKRFCDLNNYLKEKYGERVQKITLDAGLSCPNRDGTISTGGCIYCNRKGSGSGSMIDRGLSISEQMEKGREYAKRRYKANKLIAYFQSFSNTHGTIEQLKSLYDEALGYSDIVGLSIGTRPDCINQEIIELLNSYSNDYEVWIEYGLQSSNNSTLLMINRGHDKDCFEKCVFLTSRYDIKICAHVILGLPGESHSQMLETAHFLSRLPIDGIKIHFLYVLKDTTLSGLYQRGEYKCLERDEYTDLVVDFLEILPPTVIVQRLTGDPDVSELLAPLWAAEKNENLDLIRERLEQRNTWQGRKFTEKDHA